MDLLGLDVDGKSDPKNSLPNAALMVIYRGGKGTRNHLIQIQRHPSLPSKQKTTTQKNHRSFVVLLLDEKFCFFFVFFFFWSCIPHGVGMFLHGGMDPLQTRPSPEEVKKTDAKFQWCAIKSWIYIYIYIYILYTYIFAYIYIYICFQIFVTFSGSTKTWSILWPLWYWVLSHQHFLHYKQHP